jgi:hypothetical protein
VIPVWPVGGKLTLHHCKYGAHHGNIAYGLQELLESSPVSLKVDSSCVSFFAAPDLPRALSASQNLLSVSFEILVSVSPSSEPTLRLGRKVQSTLRRTKSGCLAW